MDTKIFEKTGVPLLLQVFPNELFVVLQAMADRWRIDYWDVGRIVNKLKVMVINDHLPVAIMDVYAVVARYLNYEVSASTVRYYASVAEFYTQDEQSEYEPLPFSHFALAMRYGRPKWKSVLDLSFSYAHIHAGQFPSVSWLEQAFSGDLDLQNGADYDIDSMDDGSGADTGQEVKHDAVALFTIALEKLSQFVTRIPVSDETKTRIADKIVELHKIFTDALKEMRG